MNNKKGYIPFSLISSYVKVIHVSNESIARCNKNIEPVILENKRIRFQSEEEDNKEKFNAIKKQLLLKPNNN